MRRSASQVKVGSTVVVGGVAARVMARDTAVSASLGALVVLFLDDGRTLRRPLTAKIEVAR